MLNSLYCAYNGVNEEREKEREREGCRHTFWRVEISRNLNWTATMSLGLLFL